MTLPGLGASVPVMSEISRQTIFALSSGRGPAAIAVVRVSGPKAKDALVRLGAKIPEPRKAGLARLRDPKSGEPIDEALALFFPGPHSETGEDVVELQLHGGRAVLAATFAALEQIEGLRPAEAGEFTRRAFENGKLDLTAVEGLADLVNAETEGQRRQAFRQMKGALGGPAESWRQRLIQALALVEARIDFSDESDVPEELVAPALAIARQLHTEIGRSLADGRRGERLREGMIVAIAGPPNAGKSTLLNRIAQREVAIVSPHAGTTRDVIEVHLDLDGWPVTLLDTAGIRETTDPVEQEGVRRACERAAAADLVLWLEDAGTKRPQTEAAVASAKRAPAEHSGPIYWHIVNKIDVISDSNEYELRSYSKNECELSANNVLINLVSNELTRNNELQSIYFEQSFNVSAVSGEGFDALIGALMRRAGKFLAGAESALITRDRHRAALSEAQGALERALGPTLAGHEDLLAEELRAAAAALGRLTGRVDVEDILDVIFRDFCIGK